MRIQRTYIQIYIHNKKDAPLNYFFIFSCAHYFFHITMSHCTRLRFLKAILK